VIPQLWYWIIDDEYVWTNFFNKFAHLVSGWAVYHLFSSTNHRKSPWIILFYSMLWGVMYEVLEIIFFFGINKIEEVLHLQWDILDMWLDLLMNLIGGFIGFGIESYFIWKKSEYMGKTLEPMELNFVDE
jgi:hypothetical protein